MVLFPEIPDSLVKPHPVSGVSLEVPDRSQEVLDNDVCPAVALASHQVHRSNGKPGSISRILTIVCPLQVSRKTTHEIQ